MKRLQLDPARVAQLRLRLLRRGLRAARRTHAWLEAVAQRHAPRVEKILGGLPSQEAIDVVDFATDADLAMLRQEPLRARMLLRTISIVFVIFLFWAAIAQLDEVTRGEGKVIPSKQLQVLQSIDGGLVSEILVHEGDVVEPNQLLVKIDATRYASSAAENHAQYLSLLAKSARLKAMADDKPFVPPPEVTKDAPDVVAQEMQYYQAKHNEMDAAVSIARQQLSQRQHELAEMQARRTQAAQGFDLTSQELAKTRPLINSGAVSEIDLLRLEREVARYRGERDQAAAEIARTQAAIGEAQRKIQEVELTFRNDASKELSDITGRLNGLAEGSVGLSDKVKQTSIRSPVKGTVKRLLVNTVGGVVQPGKDVIEIVPLEDTLLLEARIAPRDIAFLRPGLPAMVKFTAYDFAIYGGLSGTLEHIGADTVTDEKGNSFYVVRVRTDKPGFGDANLPIIPGMVAEVDILTGKKSVLAYLMKPVLRAKSVAMTER